MALAPPQFDNEFRRQLRELFAWRRDVRRFRSDPIDPSTIEEILDVACLAPSFGNSQPWRFVAVNDLDRKSTRLNSSHSQISYAVFCLKKKNTTSMRNLDTPLRRVSSHITTLD